MNVLKPGVAVKYEHGRPKLETMTLSRKKHTTERELTASNRELRLLELETGEQSWRAEQSGRATLRAYILTRFVERLRLA